MAPVEKFSFWAPRSGQRGSTMIASGVLVLLPRLAARRWRLAVDTRERREPTPFPLAVREHLEQRRPFAEDP